MSPCKILSKSAAKWLSRSYRDFPIFKMAAAFWKRQMALIELNFRYKRKWEGGSRHPRGCSTEDELRVMTTGGGVESPFNPTLQGNSNVVVVVLILVV